jgi:hypothetical protein
MVLLSLSKKPFVLCVGHSVEIALTYQGCPFTIQCGGGVQSGSDNDKASP